MKAIISLLSSLFTVKSLVNSTGFRKQSLLTVITEVVVMLFFGVALSQIVTDLAVTPLERMLGTSVQIVTVFDLNVFLPFLGHSLGIAGR